MGDVSEPVNARSARADLAASEVIVWEPRGSEVAALPELLSRAGVRVVSTGARNIGAETLHDRVIVLAASAFDGRIADLERTVDTWTRQGCAVVACQARADAWPVTTRCRLLLAGCVAILDAGQRDFASELIRHTSEAQRSRVARRRDVAELADRLRSVGIVAESRVMLELGRRLVRLSAVSDAPTVITGETGTGKELLARALHAFDDKRGSGPFVALNCGALTSSLAESELFGHRRGAFTGADRDRKGLIRAAHGGVLFLDEVSELGGAVQAKLLRVLQEQRVLAVGDEHEVPVSVRVIAATNTDLRGMVERGTFRADLFHRLNVLSLEVPPLSKRREDIPPLIAHFVRKHHTLRAGGAPCAVASDFVEAVTSLDLPGNARQLENLVRGALVRNDGTTPLGLRDLPPDVWRQLVGPETASPAPPVDGSTDAETVPDLGDVLAANGWNLSRSLDSCERSFVESALRASNGNQSRAARMLGITPRSVYNKLRRHHLA